MSVLTRYLAGEISGPMTALELLCETEDVDGARRCVDDRMEGELRHASKERLASLGSLFTTHLDGCRTIVRMLREGKDSPRRFADPDEGVHFARELFDSSVTVDQVLAVAMWSLGDREILERATSEVVAWARATVPVRPSDAALDLGCGTGRYVRAFAPYVARITGLDVSSRMIDVARAEATENATWVVGSGRTLPFEDAAFDVVLAIDSFPYVHQGGDDLVRELTREVCRVLAPSGRFSILNLAYGDDPARDAGILASIANDTGLAVARSGRPSATWSVPGWVLTRPDGALDRARCR